jgi:hypothetical protein
MPYTTQAKKNPTDLKCECTTGEYQCRRCYRSFLEAIDARMSQADHAYDRLALAGWRSEA